MQRSRWQTEQILHNHAMAEKQKKDLMYINRFLRMPFSQMTFDMISDIYDQFSRSLITFIVLQMEPLLKPLVSYPIHTF